MNKGLENLKRTYREIVKESMNSKKNKEEKAEIVKESKSLKESKWGDFTVYLKVNGHPFKINVVAENEEKAIEFAKRMVPAAAGEIKGDLERDNTWEIRNVVNKYVESACKDKESSYSQHCEVIEDLVDRANTMTTGRIFINGNRNGYNTKQCGRTLTVGELISILRDFDENAPIYLKNDGGYTYGSIRYDDVYEETEEELEESKQPLKEEAKIYVGLDSYEPWSGAKSTWDKIVDADRIDDFDALLEEVYPDGLTMVEVNDILWFDSDWVLDALGLSEEDEEE